MSLVDLIALDKHRIRRQLYIKRRLIDGSYESDWLRIDNWNGIDLVIDWGGVGTQIDYDPGIVASFEVSGVTLIVDNNEGLFGVETSANSIWSPESDYLNRRYTKIKITTGYLDENDDLAFTNDDFEGLIDNVSLSEDGLANLECLSYQFIFTRYPISELSLIGSVSASSVVTSISNQSKITEFMPYVAPSLDNDYTINDASQLDGTYWDILQEIAYYSNSTIVLEGTVFKLVPRTPGSVEWNFKGSGSDEEVDVYSINAYDDEGIGKIRVYWQEENGTTFSKSTDSTLLLKYLSEPELVNLTNVASGSKQSVLDNLLTKWQNPIPTIEFDCKYLLNELALLDKITIEVRGKLSPSIEEGAGLWSNFFWSDGTLWGQELGGIIINSGIEWLVTRIFKDFNTGRMTIRAERTA